MNDGSGPGLHRRQVLGVTVGVVGLAGCLGGGSGDDDGDAAGDENGATDGSGTPSPGDDSPGPTVTNLTPADCEGESVSNDVTTDTTWSVGECPRVVLSDRIEVKNGATLTIEPGVEVVGNYTDALVVRDTGTLEAAGDPSNPVWFHGENLEPGDWVGIVTKGEGSVTLDNVVAEHGGSGNPATLTLKDAGRASVTNSLFRGSNGAGLAVNDNDATLTDFASNAFRGNDGHAIKLWASNVGALDTASSYTGDNDPDGIFLKGGRIEREGRWPAAPIRLSRSDVEVAAPVTVEAGARVRAREGGKS